MQDPLDARAAAILEIAPQAIVLAGEDGVIRAVNAAAARMLGYTREELAGQPVEVLLPERLRAGHGWERLAGLAAPEVRPTGRGQALVARRKDGSELPVEISLGVLGGEAGGLAVAFIADVSERRRAERRLRTEFAVTGVLLERPALEDAAPGLIEALCRCLDWELGELWLVDGEARVLRWAGAWHGDGIDDAAAFAAASQALVFPPGGGIPGRAWSRGEPTWLLDVTEDAAFLRLAEARRIGLRGTCAVPIRSRDEIVGVAVLFGRELRRPDPELVDLLADIGSRIGLYVEHRRTQAALQRQREVLQQRERLAALGTLAAGLAHEINNPIAVLSSRIELMLQDDGGPVLPAEVHEDLLVLQRNVRRVGELAQGLLAFARQSPRERCMVDLNRIVEETLLLVERHMRAAGIEVRRVLDRTLPPILGDAGALQQVTLNLLTNAREAMGGPGTVGIETRRAADRRDRVELVVADSGPGIPSETLPRVFDPFFTTKVQGTGLGLSISYGIVQTHGGTIRVASEPGQGTAFTVAFPVGGEAAIEPASPGEPRAG